MTITIYWWMLPLALFSIPFIVGFFERPSGGYIQFQEYTVASFVLCWPMAIGIVIGHFI